jgi:putative FmdB family regulatory protein
LPLYGYRCGCGTSFEALMPVEASMPDCPHCGATPRKVLSGFAIGGRASAGRSQAEMPQTWKATHGADRDYVTGLRRQWDERQRLEERHPDLAGDRRPVLAHEGPYQTSPLRPGDDTTRPGHPHGGAGHIHDSTGAVRTPGPGDD